MGTRISCDKPDQALRNLDEGDTISVIGSRGTVVRCLAGRLWVTQEGDARDYIVPTGTRFCAGRDGRIVIGAVADQTQIAVYCVAPVPKADWTHNVVRIDADFVDRIRQVARREQARFLATLISAAWRRIRRFWRQCLETSGYRPDLRMRGAGKGG